LQNNFAADPSLPEAQLEKAFNRWWNDFHQRVEAVKAIEVDKPKSKRDPEDMVEEFLNIVRSIDSRVARPPLMTLSDRRKTALGRRLYGISNNTFEGSETDVARFAHLMQGLYSIRCDFN